MKILAFDYGASSGRAIVGTYENKILSLKEVHRFASDPVYMNDVFTWDFLRLFLELKRGILKAYQGGDSDIASIGIDTWGVDFGLLSKDGQLLGNPIHYRDSRTDGMIEKACLRVPAEKIYEITGIAFQKFNTLYQLLALNEADSVLLKDADCLLFIPDLFNYFLTGEKKCEYTITSTAQLYDPVKGDWAYDLIKEVCPKVNTDIFPEVIPAGTKVGNLSESICDELGVKSIPVIGVAEHDTGSAVVSVPFYDTKSAYLSSGTWSLLGVELEKPIINETTRTLNYTNEGGINNTVRLLKNIMGLWIQQECKRHWEKLGETVSFNELDEACDKAAPFSAIIDVDDATFFEPNNMPIKIQDYCRRTNQKVPETKGEILRLVMEGLALKYREAIEGLEKIVGYKIPALHIVGGGCKNKVLSQFTANAINRPVYAGPIEATAVGNLVTQLIAMGEIKDLAEAREVVRNSFPIEEYVPADIEAWEDAYNRYKKLTGK
ncbi:MAG: rhamnulokinase [Clostridia bacterium]|nr:rhamnulokinase [Clostridia bacterium]